MQRENVSAKNFAVSKRRIASFVAAAVLSLSLGVSKPASADIVTNVGMAGLNYFTGGAASKFISSFSLPNWPVAVASSIINPCGALPAIFTGVFTVNPCGLARNVLGLEFAQNYLGGQQTSMAFEELSRKNIIPGLQAQTAQHHASRLDATRQYGSFLDAQNAIRTAREKQELERDSKANNTPSENACVAGTAQPAMAITERSARAITQSLKNELNKRSANAPDSTAPEGPASDTNARWTQYLNEFHDTSNDNGYIPAPAGQGIPNGDITVETVLLKDTINMEDDHEYAAARAMLTNLVQPIIHEKIPDDVVNTPTGEQWILKQQHIESARNIAADTITSIMANHTSLPEPQGQFSETAVGSLTDEKTPDPTDPGGGGPATCTGEKDYSCFLRSLGFSESGGSCKARNQFNYVGRYQFGMEALVGLGYVQRPTADQMSRYGAQAQGNWYKIPAEEWVFTSQARSMGVSNLEEYKSEGVGCALQEKGVLDFHKRNWASIKDLVGKKMPDGTVWDESSLLAGSHMLGAGGIRNCIMGNVGAAGGGCKDGNKVSVFDYVTGRRPPGPSKLGYNIESVTDGAPSPITPDEGGGTPDEGGGTPTAGGGGGIDTAGKTYAQFVYDIRSEAGVKPCDASDAPAYYCIAKRPSRNELLLALTKERYTPKYFSKIHENKGAIKQEQAAINTYITMMYQDIQVMQERINALMSARAALNLNTDEKPNQIDATPLR